MVSLVPPASADAASLLLDALSERAPPAPSDRDPSDRDEEDLAERLKSGDRDAVPEALALAHARTLWRRTAALLAYERAPVRLADGQTLSLDDAEKRLAEKEERRVFPALRKTLDAHAKDAMRALEEAGRDFDAIAARLGLSPAKELPDVEQARASLTALLDETRGLSEACLELLERTGGASARDPAGLSRALDLPDERGGFSTGAARAFGRALKEAAGERLARGIVRLVTPRALAGLVVSAAPGPVRVASCEGRRAGRFAALADAAATGVACALFDESALSPFADESARLLGRALGFSAFSPTVRRTLLGESRADAETRSRIGRATWLLQTRARAAVARALLEELPAESSEDIAPDERAAQTFELARDALANALGTAPEDGFVRALLLPPWPGPARLRGTLASLGSFALQSQLAADLFLRLRERFDEAFALVPAPYDLVASATDPLKDGALSVLALVEGGEARGPRGMVEWVGEGI